VAPTQDKVAQHWSDKLSDSGAFESDVYWLALPAVQEYYTRRATRGRRSDSWVNDCVETFLGPGLPVDRILSIGCGNGELERHLAMMGVFRHCEAMDISPGSIATARAQAAAAGLTNIDYRVTDANLLELPAASYDAVWFNSSLHHIAELERACFEVARSLRPGGWLFLNEYVGAPAFAFPPRQVEAIRAAFALIPPHLRRRSGADGQLSVDLSPIPDPVAVAEADPSEAVRSDEILDVVHQYFEVVECNPAGGTLLQFVLNGIAGHFDRDAPEARAILDLLLQIESTLIDRGDLASDFVVLAARPRASLPTRHPLPPPARPPRRTIDEMPGRAVVRRFAKVYSRTRARLRKLLGLQPTAARGSHAPGDNNPS
jgi:2-polyprenyl-3-methyl-5-hydroxy-6-metoxy-1,4-benzoquinol methylase